RLNRWTSGSIQDQNALVEQPKPEGIETKGEPKESVFKEPAEPQNLPDVVDVNQNVFDRAKQPAEERKRPNTRWGKGPVDLQQSTSIPFKISPRKLQKLARQIAGSPVDYAILQMQFSDKKAARKIKGLLEEARDDAQRVMGMNRGKLVVSESWALKHRTEKRIDIKGRGRMGIMETKYSRIWIRLREGQTPEERAEERRQKVLKRVRSAGVTREDRPLRNVSSAWTW
ncbi:ribosomal protein L22, partial [Auriculariales sp. MPI-PUGE-AT-0066]